MSELTEQYNTFVRTMWVENCAEREAYNEKPLSHIEYRTKNQSFLEEAFYSIVADNIMWSEEKLDYIIA